MSGPAGPLNPGGPFAVVSGPPEIVNAAAAMQPLQPAPPPQPGLPPGPGEPPVVPPAKAAMSTGMKVALGVGAVAVVGGLIYASRKG